jgi:capsular polysaccharide biosynthesis protein
MSTTNETHEYSRINMKELGYRLLSRWKLILSIALLFSIIMAVISIFILTPTYEATSTIYVLEVEETSPNLSDLQIGEALINDYLKVFRMWEIHEAVRNKLNLSYTYHEMEGMLSVQNALNSRMIDITVRSTDPEEAAAMANAYANVVSEFIEEKMQTDKPGSVSAALVPTAPASPNTVRNIILGFLIGSVLTCAYVVIKMVLDDKVRTADDILKYTGWSTLALVPEEKNDTKRKGGKSA